MTPSGSLDSAPLSNLLPASASSLNAISLTSLPFLDEDDKENQDPLSQFESPELMRKIQTLTLKAKRFSKNGTQIQPESGSKRSKNAVPSSENAQNSFAKASKNLGQSGSSFPLNENQNTFITNVKVSKGARQRQVLAPLPVYMKETEDLKGQIKDVFENNDDLEDVRKLLKTVQGGLDRFREELMDVNQNCLRVHNDLKNVNLGRNKKLLEENEKMLRQIN